MEAIPLAATLFWDPSFLPCPRHTLKLATKLGLRTRTIPSNLVKERIEIIWANKTISQLDRLFKDNPDWWTATAIIYAQPALTKS